MNPPSLDTESCKKPSGIDRIQVQRVHGTRQPIAGINHTVGRSDAIRSGAVSISTQSEQGALEPFADGCRQCLSIGRFDSLKRCLDRQPDPPGLLQVTDPDTKEMIVTSIHPGIAREEIDGNTGWTVRYAASVAETPRPTAAELAVLRDLHARTKAANAGAA